eukprot:augustus_masked-scaffold_22-processed-gene-3.38-mRNA-1 protein AED:0.38 eAED:0.40 QI:0/-1/0/1/-1/1/1/0/460
MLKNETQEEKKFMLSVFLSDRSDVNLALGNLEIALNDAVNGLSAFDGDYKRWIHLVNLIAKIGKPKQAKEQFHKAKTKFKDEHVVNEFLAGEKEIERFEKKLQTVVELLNSSGLTKSEQKACLLFGHELLSVSSSSLMIKVVVKAEILYGSLTKAIKLCTSALREKTDYSRINQILQSLGLDVDFSDQNTQLELFVLLSEAYLFCNDLDSSLKYVKQALKLDPDLSSGQKMFKRIKLVQRKLKDADKFASRLDFTSAEEVLKDLIENFSSQRQLRVNSPLGAHIFAERSLIYYKMGEKFFDQGLKDAQKALEIQSDQRRAWLTKIYIYQQRKQFQKAIDELSTVVNSESWGSHDEVLKNALEKSKFLLRKSKRKDYYKILTPSDGSLNLSRLSSEVEIKAAYKKKALEVHPDRKDGNDEEFKLVGEAFEVLTDQRKRKLYDEGYDKKGIEEVIQREKQRH